MKSELLRNLGVDSELAGLLGYLFGNEPTAADVVTLLPSGYELELSAKSLHSVPNGSKVMLNVQSVDHRGSISYRRNFGRRNVYQISAFTDGKEPISLVFFKTYPAQIERFAVGKKNTIVGRLEIVDRQFRIAHPQLVFGKQVDGVKVLTRWSSLDGNAPFVGGGEGGENGDGSEGGPSVSSSALMELETDDSREIPIEAIYRLPKGVKRESYGYVVQRSLSAMKDSLLKIKCDGCEFAPDLQGQTLFEVVRSIHCPKSILELKSLGDKKRCLGVFEVVANKLALRIAESKGKNAHKEPVKSEQKLMKEVFSRLPFSITDDQQKAIEDIIGDQAGVVRTSRLLQGDVGCGKTLVALGAMLNAVEAKGRAILVAPTTVLAMQHFRFVSDLLFGMNIGVFLLTGNTKESERKRLKTAIDNGMAHIIIGTHAIMESEYIKDCHLCVIDEQHRFGVKQRAVLADKHPAADLLMMTATPIPRTMLSVMYDNVLVSTVKQMPKSRKPIITTMMSDAKLSELMKTLGQRVEKEKAKAYWICPAVEMNEESAGLVSTEERFESLCEYIPKEKLFVMHGKLKERQKDQVMLDFAGAQSGAVLVATSVIEVGIDVPESTIMVIEQSERFGLSQLHQLRGRVGRGSAQSYCSLVYSANCSPESMQRLSVIRNSTDGFHIAENDFQLRGAGDLIGFRQSGYNNFKIAGGMLNRELCLAAKDLTDKMVGKDFEFPLRGDKVDLAAVESLLGLFGYAEDMFKVLHY